MLRAANQWIKEYGPNTAFGNTIERRYLQNTNYVKNAASEAERRKLRGLVALFQKYGSQYHFDPIMLAAQGYQESTLDQDVKSAVGAIGVMQVMPATGAELKVGDIRQAEPNIHAGTKYMDLLMTKYFSDANFDEQNRTLFAFASYNAGPATYRRCARRL